MIALMTTDGRAVALEPDFFESVEQPLMTIGRADVDRADTCKIRMSSGSAFDIDRSYTYVTGIVRTHYNPKPRCTNETH